MAAILVGLWYVVRGQFQGPDIDRDALNAINELEEE